MKRLQDHIKRIEEFNPKANFDLLRKAYVYSAKVHKGQIRKSGEPYFTHPFEVAGILIDLRQDIPTIATGFLHDTVEDTLATLEEIEEFFGKDVAFLVDGVTKMGKISFSSRAEHQAENFRKMLVAMAKDIRVLLVKLADRTHNMRTLSYLSVAKQEEISRETLEIYAPLANRLGIYWMRSELEDLALKYLKPQIYEKLDKEMRKFRKSKEKYIDNVLKLLREKMKKYGLDAEVSGRLKNIAGIYRKMEARSLTFDQIHDIIAFRIIVEEVGECYEALGLIHSMWKPVPTRFKDFIAMPKDNLYQSLHTTVIGPHGERVEIQIRTREMHHIADTGIAAHWKYKEGGKVDKREEMRFQWLRQLLEWQQELKDPTEFMQSIKDDLFDQSVFLFTPKGEVKSFPKGATPVDFAYSIHTEVGHHCVGCKVNGRIVPLKYQLRSGETVEILTNKGSKPNKDWLNFVRSGKALNNIRTFLKKEQRKESIEVGREILEVALKRYSINLNKLIKSMGLEEVIDKHRQGNLENLFANLGLGHITVNQIVDVIVPKEQLQSVRPVVEKHKKGAFGRFMQKVSGGGRATIKIGGQADVMTTLAQCCNPLPGDAITGYVTRGRGVTVHTAGCPMVLATEEERRISVDWDDHHKGIHSARIKVVCVDQPGLLAKLSRAITLTGVNIVEAQIRTTSDKKAVNHFMINVEDLSQLRNLIKRLEEVDGVISVERIRTNV